ncbi:MAG: shikimate dehydrogenase family protein [Holosporaceae bacterium]|jgi:shikimate dehydrogenase|nr:shikimate dehydrogenase [Rhodospirillaceae bacterium]
MIQTGLLAWPAGHSLSPLIHNFWLKQAGIAGDYRVHAVPPQALKQQIEELVAAGYRGFNLTLPHKTAVLPLLTSLSPLARHVGAVNTVVVGADGQLYGDNTDVAGFVTPLRQHWDFRGDQRVAQQGLANQLANPLVDALAKDEIGKQELVKQAVLLGAGGAARAVVAGLAELGVDQLTIAARRPQAVAELAEALQDLPHCPRIAYLPWGEGVLTIPPTDLLINSTPLGMVGQPPLLVNLDQLPPAALVYDLVYRPRQTALLQAAAGRGLATQDGLEMLLAQAAPAFAAWYGVQPEITDALRAMVHDAAQA